MTLVHRQPQRLSDATMLNAAMTLAIFEKRMSPETKKLAEHTEIQLALARLDENVKRILDTPVENWLTKNGFGTFKLADLHA